VGVGFLKLGVSHNKQEKIIKWTALPSRNKKKRILFWFSLFAIVSFIYAFGGLFWGIFSLVILLATTASFYTPTTYILKEDHLEIKRPLYTQKREWKTLKRVVPDKKGVFLSPFSRPSRLDAFRGFYLLLDGAENREEIIEFLKEKIEGAKEKNGDHLE